MDILDEALKAQQKMLREFGYPTLKLETLQGAHERWKAGKKAEGVIEMMAFKDYDERPELFGERAS